jgi:hypothetical protein
MTDHHRRSKGDPPGAERRARAAEGRQFFMAVHSLPGEMTLVNGIPAPS